MIPRRLALKRCDSIATEPTAAKPAAEATPAAARLWSRWSSEVEKLSGRRSDDPDQQCDRDRQHDQLTAVDKNPERRL